MVPVIRVQFVTGSLPVPFKIIFGKTNVPGFSKSKKQEICDKAKEHCDFLPVEERRRYVINELVTNRKAKEERQLCRLRRTRY